MTCSSIGGAASLFLVSDILIVVKGGDEQLPDGAADGPELKACSAETEVREAEQPRRSVHLRGGVR